MRRLLVILAIGFLLVIVGVAVGLATFDADRYRPLLVDRLQHTLGAPVTLDHLALAWQKGIAVRLDGLTIKDEAASPDGEPLLHVESVSALIRLLPLLRKEVHVSSVVLKRPRAHVARDAHGRLNLTALAAVASPAAAASVRTTAAGSATVSLDIASVRLEEGLLHFTDAMASPPTELWIKALEVTVTHIVPGEPMDLVLTGALAEERPNVRLSGRLTLPSPTSEGSCERLALKLERVSLDRLLPAAGAGQPRLRGTLTVTLQGTVGTLDPARALRAMSGSGTLKLDEPTIENLNVLRAVFEQFSMIPGLVPLLESRLPSEFQEVWAAKDTVLAPLDVSMDLDGGVMRVHNLVLRTEMFGIAGDGRISVEGVAHVPSVLRIEPAFSMALIKSVNELQGLANPQGQIEIPLTIQGRLPQVVVLPDLNYLASKVLVRKAVDLLGELLNKHQGASEPDETEAGQTSGSEGGLLERLLQDALKKHAPSNQ